MSSCYYSQATVCADPVALGPQPPIKLLRMLYLRYHAVNDVEMLMLQTTLGMLCMMLGC